MEVMKNPISMGRRQMLIGGILCGGLLATNRCAEAVTYAPAGKDKSLWLQRHETGEEVRCRFWGDGQIDPHGYAQVCHILRDVRAGKTVPMRLGLLERAHWVQQWFALHGQNRPIEVLSGYRTVATNVLINESSKTSRHLIGGALDFRMRGVPVSYLERLASLLASGGVGSYLHRDFLHLDDGPFRQWRRG